MERLLHNVNKNVMWTRDCSLPSCGQQMLYLDAGAMALLGGFHQAFLLHSCVSRSWLALMIILLVCTWLFAQVPVNVDSGV